MKITVRTVEYFEWELSDELMKLLEKDKDNATPVQNLIDEFFHPDNPNVTEIGDIIYEEA